LIPPMIVDRSLTNSATTMSVCPCLGVPTLVESGGYVVQPAAPVPIGTKKDDTAMPPERQNVQKDNILRSGNAMFLAPIMRGMQKLPNASMRIGVMAKKIMMRPCVVKIEG